MDDPELNVNDAIEDAMALNERIDAVTDALVLEEINEQGEGDIDGKNEHNNIDEGNENDNGDQDLHVIVEDGEETI